MVFLVEAASIQAARDKLARENPVSFQFGDDADGSECAGGYVGDDQGKTRDGEQVPIKLIKGEDGVVRSLWMFESPALLREKWAEANPSIGDYVIVKRYPKRKTADGERYYWPFAVATVPGEAPSPSGGGPGVATEEDLEEAAQQARERDEQRQLEEQAQFAQAPLEGGDTTPF